MSYQSDLYEWTKEQADALRRRAPNSLDWDNLAEEIESLGTSQRSEIRSRLKVLLVHLLKWRHQPELRCGSWRGSIREARDQIEDLLEDNPSLRAYPAECLTKAYARARLRALDETGLLCVPETCPWTIEDVLAGDFWL
ncbi:uncharacterized protein DUF29 [Roseiarcus fermentans]|uniref:Uncharacterized protein DUF29 n=1 Tax=Roseiarcus fermentans TaxID=1473586 RepID=A0A366F7C0_9HYPH|nr:DUF29 domain-containing protein [Roseiarcus fermentans]RBP10538.1 uncharacterized protein DUF29 [Roseiarcus fermentans]